MKAFYGIISALALSFICASCSSTPLVRIEENPQVFQSLSVDEQKLVSAGQISTGMGPEAVYLAWGRPNNTPIQGEKDGSHYMKWIYTSSTAYSTNVAWGSPYNYYGYGPRYYPYQYSYMDTTFIETPVAEVTFVNNKVTSWQSR